MQAAGSAPVTPPQFLRAGQRIREDCSFIFFYGVKSIFHETTSAFPAAWTFRVSQTLSAAGPSREPIRAALDCEHMVNTSFVINWEGERLSSLSSSSSSRLYFAFRPDYCRRRFIVFTESAARLCSCIRALVHILHTCPPSSSPPPPPLSPTLPPSHIFSSCFTLCVQFSALFVCGCEHGKKKRKKKKLCPKKRRMSH